MSKKKVLIDDDILIQLGWQLKAEKEDYAVDCFFSVDEFLAVAGEYSSDIEVYIDSSLIEDISSSIQAKRVSELGFFNIYLKTESKGLQEQDSNLITKFLFKS